MYAVIEGLQDASCREECQVYFGNPLLKLLELQFAAPL